MRSAGPLSATMCNAFLITFQPWTAKCSEERDRETLPRVFKGGTRISPWPPWSRSSDQTSDCVCDWAAALGPAEVKKEQARLELINKSNREVGTRPESQTCGATTSAVRRALNPRFLTRGPGRKPGASLYTTKRHYLASPLSV